MINKTLKGQIESHNHQEDRRWVLECYQNHSAIWGSLADPYVTCFCANGNLLSQWRAYAANGSGFAIEFEPTRLMDTFKNDADIVVNAKLFRVIYDEKEQTRLIEEAIEQLVKAFGTHEKQDVLDCVPRVFSEMSYCFKHPAFAEEQEWRLVFMPRAERFLNVRVSRGQLLPYASLPFSMNSEQPPTSPSSMDLRWRQETPRKQSKC